MNYSTQFENLSATDRVLRFIVSIAAIVAAMGSGLAGTSALTAISVLAIALATTAIIGWSPLKSMSSKVKSLFTGSEIGQNEKYA